MQLGPLWFVIRICVYTWREVEVEWLNQQHDTPREKRRKERGKKDPEPRAEFGRQLVRGTAIFLSVMHINEIL
jgi:hypothetical protein